MAKRNSVGSHDMPRQNAFRPAYGTAQDSDDVSKKLASTFTTWHYFGRTTAVWPLSSPLSPTFSSSSPSPSPSGAVSR